MSYSDETNTKLNEWALKLGRKPEDVVREFNTILQTQQQNHPMTAPMALEKKARSILFTKLKSENSGFRSPAIMFKGIVLGRTEPFDVNQKSYEAAINRFKADQGACTSAFTAAKQYKEQKQEIPANVLANLFTNENGVPIDNRPSFKSGMANQNFLNVLPEHSWLSNVFALAGPEGGPVLPLRMTLTDVRATAEVPIGRPVQFRANPKKGVMDAVKTGTAKAYECNDSTTTMFEAALGSDIPSVWRAIEMPELAQFKSVLADLKAYHDRTKTDYNRVVIVQGTATQCNPEPVGSRGNYRFVMDDESLGFNEDQRGITVWVPSHLAQYYNFAEGSEAIVIAQTQEGQAYDYTNRAPDPTKTEITLNAIGLLVNPELRVAREEVPSTTSKGSEQLSM
jgi:hypothetical protein